MSAFRVFVILHSGVRLCIQAMARSRLEAQLQALDCLSAPPRFCRACPVGRVA